MNLKKIVIIFFIFFLTISINANSTDIDIKIEYPSDGATIVLPSNHVVIEGHAFAKSEDIPLVDLMIAIDSSGSTGRPSGVDVNQNGIIGRKVKEVRIFGLLIGSKITDPGDSVLAAEVQAAKNLLKQLDPNTTRVGIVNFGGDFLPGTGYDGDRTFMVNPATPDAFLKQPLTSDFKLVNRALNQIYQEGASGGTNISEGIRVAISELSGTKSSVSLYKPNTQKIILLLSDGVPTFPVGSASVSDPEDKSLAISAAQLASIANIKINTFSLGTDSLRETYTLEEISRQSRGIFTAVPNPGDIITVLSKTSFAELDFVDVINSTFAERAQEIVLNPIGDFIASVPVRDGLNKISATANASDGTKAENSITITFKKLDRIENLRELLLTKKSDLSLELERKKNLEKTHKKALVLELERARERNKILDDLTSELKRQLEQRQHEEGRKEAEIKKKKERLELELEIKDNE